MRNLKLFEEFDRDEYKSHWYKFKTWLTHKDFELYDGEAALFNMFMKVANDNDLAVEEKSKIICDYLDEFWGLYDGKEEVNDYLDTLFMDEV